MALPQHLCHAAAIAELAHDAGRHRAHALRVQGRAGDVAVNATVALAEISGSDTFVHLDTALGAVVAQLAGVHYFDLGDAMPVYFRPQDVYVFDSAGMLALAPSREGGH